MGQSVQRMSCMDMGRTATLPYLLPTRVSPVNLAFPLHRHAAQQKKVLEQLKPVHVRGGTGVRLQLRLRLVLVDCPAGAQYVHAHKIACRPATGVLYFPGTVFLLKPAAVFSRAVSSRVPFAPCSFSFPQSHLSVCC
jgi:hypothetical protein